MTFSFRFACLVGVCLIAMVIGFVYKRFYMGAKGWEQIPMLSYFKDFGSLQAVSATIITNALWMQSCSIPRLPPMAKLSGRLNLSCACDIEGKV